MVSKNYFKEKEAFNEWRYVKKSYGGHIKKINDTCWFIYEKEDSLCQSFVITLAYDGSIMLSGDMGTTVTKPNGCGYSENYIQNLVYWVYNCTNLHYFSEKYAMGHQKQDRLEFDVEYAKKDLRRYLVEIFELGPIHFKDCHKYLDFFNDNFDGDITDIDKQNKYRVAKFYEDIQFDNEYDLHSEVSKLENNLGVYLDFWESNVGRKYSSRLKLHFAMLKLWSWHLVNIELKDKEQNS